MLLLFYGLVNWDKMLINYFGNSSMLSIERLGRSWSTAKNYCISMTIFSLTLFTLGLFCVKCPGEGGRFNHFKYFENRKSYINKFCLFQQTFTYEKVKGNIIKRQKTSGFKHFSLPRYSKKWTAY